MNVLVCDDENTSLEMLSRMVTIIGHTVVAKAKNGREALDMVNEFKPDVCLLDVRMPEMDGIACAEALSHLDHPPAVIFVTGFDEHAMDAFRAQAIGYLIKPAKPTDLMTALLRAQRLNAAQMTQLRVMDNATKPKETRRHIAARTHRGVELIAIESIYYFLADQKYVTVRHAGGQVLIDETLKDLEAEFGDSFVRIHRNALLSVQHLEGLEAMNTGQYQVRFRGIPDQLAVSRRHLPELRKKMNVM